MDMEYEFFKAVKNFETNKDPRIILENSFLEKAVHERNRTLTSKIGVSSIPDVFFSRFLTYSSVFCR